jgi:hypothetical protein
VGGKSGKFVKIVHSSSPKGPSIIILIDFDLYGVLCKKICMSFLHDDFGCMVALGQFET